MCVCARTHTHTHTQLQADCNKFWHKSMKNLQRGTFFSAHRFLHCFAIRNTCSQPLTRNFFSRCMFSCFSSVRLLVTPRTVDRQAPLSMGFSSKNSVVDCHFCLQEIFPMQGSNPRLMSPALADRFFTTSATWKALHSASHNLFGLLLKRRTLLQ